MVINGLATCDSCRKARKALPDARFRDLRDAPPSADEIALWIDQLGEGVLNRASTTWRALTDEQRAEPVADLLAAHPTLIKRPLIERDGALLLGWTPATRAALGLD